MSPRSAKELAAIVAALVITILVFAFGDARASHWDDCTRDGKFSKSTCYGIEHGLIAGVVVGSATAIDRRLALPFGAGACVGFFIREAVSVSGAFGSPDDIFDWVTPCAVSGVIVWNWGDQSWLPMFLDDGFGAFYKSEF